MPLHPNGSSGRIYVIPRRKNKEKKMFMIAYGECIACKRDIHFNPVHVPSIYVEGIREPLCVNCFDLWNEVHRVSKDLEPVSLHPRAYVGEPEQLDTEC